MEYTIGAGDPAVTRDVGSGAWKTEPATWDARTEKLFIMANIAHAAVLVGRHAAAHLNHYFGNTGADFWIDLRSMVNDAPSAKDVFDTEVQAARKFAESLPPGETQIASTKQS